MDRIYRKEQDLVIEGFLTLKDVGYITSVGSKLYLITDSVSEGMIGWKTFHISKNKIIKDMPKEFFTHENTKIFLYNDISNTYFSMQ